MSLRWLGTSFEKERYGIIDSYAVVLCYTGLLARLAILDLIKSSEYFIMNNQQQKVKNCWATEIQFGKPPSRIKKLSTETDWNGSQKQNGDLIMQNTFRNDTK